MTSSTSSALAVPWFRREDYYELRKTFPDGDNLPGRYDRWLRQAERIVEAAHAEKRVVVKATIDPREFSDWCRARGLSLDADARQQYADWYLQQKRRNTG